MRGTRPATDQGSETRKRASGPGFKQTFLLPEVRIAAEARPASCPRCTSSHLTRHGIYKRAIVDTDVTQAEVARYRCSMCRHTFRRYPEGIKRSGPSERVLALLALLRCLGLSYTASHRVLKEAHVAISPVTVWRALQGLEAPAGQALPRGASIRVLESTAPMERTEGEIALRFLKDPVGGRTVAIELQSDVGHALSPQMQLFLWARGVVTAP